MDYKKTALEIYNKVGGSSNIVHVTHCATRLRFTLKDNSLADQIGIESMREVTGLVTSNNQFQVVIGPDVAGVYRELPGTGSADSAEKKGNFISRGLDFIAGCFTPMIAIIAAGGMIQVLISLLQLTGILSDTSDTYVVLHQISQAAFFFIPIYLGSSVATRLKVDAFLGMLVGGIFVLPSLSALIGGEGGITLFGLTIPNVSYGASVVPVLLSVFLMSFVYKFADRFIPQAVKFILRPLITIIVIAPIALLFVGPLGVWIGNGVASFLSFLSTNLGPVALMFMGAFAQLLVMTGMHATLAPILIASLATYGFDGLIVPGMLIGLATQVGICLAAGIKAKDRDFKQICFSSSITAAMGVSEPALYGVTLRLKKPLVGMLIGGALGGLYFGIMSINTPVIIASFVAIPSYSNVIHTIIGVLITSFLTFIYTWIFVKESDYPVAQIEGANPIKTADSKDSSIRKKVVQGVVKGTVMSLSEVKDAAFSSMALGKGIAIRPEHNMVKAPFDGTVSAVFPGNHAIGLTSDEGIELLIHIGIDTVNLKGEGFTRLVEEGQKISLGQELIQFDKAFIESNHFDSIVMVTVTNTDDFLDIIPTDDSKTSYNQSLITILA